MRGRGQDSSGTRRLLDRLDAKQDSGENSPWPADHPSCSLSFLQSLAGGWTGIVFRSRCQLMPGFPQGAGPTGPPVCSELFSRRATSSCFEGFPESYNASVPWNLQGNPQL